MLYSLEENKNHKLHLRDEELCFLCLRAEYKHKLFGILLDGRFVSSSHILSYPNIYLYQYIFIEIYFILYFIARIVPELVIRSSFGSVQFNSVAKLCLTLCDPMDCSMPVLPVHHQLPEFTQTHVHSVSDAIQPSHPVSYPYPPAFNLSQHQGLFQWVSSSNQVAKVLVFSFSISPSNEYKGLISFRSSFD